MHAFSSRLGLPLSLLLVAPCALAQDVAERAPEPRGIVQQRLPDGSIVFTDRPSPTARTLRTWQFDAEDPASALARREAARRESEVVSERIARQLEQQRERDLQLDLARAHASRARAERDAARARAEAEQTRVVAGPSWWWWPGWRPYSVLPHKPPIVRPGGHHPGPQRPPRPGATPPPGSLLNEPGR